MKLAPFISGTFGTIGFTASIMAGLFADNGVEEILLKAMMFALLCYIVGYGVGIVAQQVASEHASMLAKKIADQDAAEETERLEQEAAAEVESAGRVASETPLSPPVNS